MANPREDPHSVASDAEETRERIQPDITVVNACGSVKVQFSRVTHINFRLDEYLGFQSWRGSDTHFFIEIELRGGRIHAEYDDQVKWHMIIAGLDQAVAQ